MPPKRPGSSLSPDARPICPRDGLKTKVSQSRYPPAHLLVIPQELRDQIFSYLQLVEDVVIAFWPTRKRRKKCQPRREGLAPFTSPKEGLAPITALSNHKRRSAVTPLYDAHGYRAMVPYLALTQTCRQLYIKITRIFWRQNRFETYHNTDRLRIWTKFSDHVLRYISHFRLQTNGNRLFAKVYYVEPRHAQPIAFDLRLHQLKKGDKDPVWKTEFSVLAMFPWLVADSVEAQQDSASVTLWRKEVEAESDKMQSSIATALNNGNGFSKEVLIAIVAGFSRLQTHCWSTDTSEDGRVLKLMKENQWIKATEASSLLRWSRKGAIGFEAATRRVQRYSDFRNAWR